MMRKNFNRSLSRLLRRVELTDIKFRFQSVHQQTVPVEDFTFEAKPYSSIPTAKRLPFVGSVLDAFKKPYGVKKLHKFLEDRTNELGDIYIEKFGSTDVVVTTNLEDFDITLQDGENSYSPKPIWSVEAYLQKYGSSHWINTDAEEYMRKKKLLHGSLMQPKSLGPSVEHLSDTTDLLVKYLDHLTTQNDLHLFEDAKHVFQKWTFQSSLALIFRKQFQLLNANPDPILLEYFDEYKRFMEAFVQLELGYPHHRIFSTKLWRSFEELWVKNDAAMEALLLENKQYYIDDNLPHANKMTALPEVVRAALHTTSITATWCLIELSRNPQIQENIVAEAAQVLTNERMRSGDLQKLHYTRGFLAEIFRVNQLAPLLGRKTSTDLVISGYHVPAGSVILMFNKIKKKDRYFDNPSVLDPNRWIRSNKNQECPHMRRTQKLAVLPFGYGKTACPGKRHAENMLYVLLVKMCQNYIIKPTSTDFDTEYDFLISPKGKMNFILEPRSNTND